MPKNEEMRNIFASSGKLRASINLGNPILASKGLSAHEPTGVSVDLAREFAKKLNVDIEFVVHDSAGKSVKCVEDGEADIGFFAIDPLRAEKISFTDAYILIEGCYLVKENSSLVSQDEVDAAKNKVMVGKGSAYDLFLTRHLKHASILRAPTSPLVVDTFLSEHADVAAGVKQQLESDMRRFSGLRLLPGSFMTIRQAMGTRRSYGDDAAHYLSDYVEEMKKNKSVELFMKNNNISGAVVAPEKI